MTTLPDTGEPTAKRLVKIIVQICPIDDDPGLAAPGKMTPFDRNGHIDECLENLRLVLDEVLKGGEKIEVVYFQR